MHCSSNSNSKLNLKPKLKLKCKPKLKPTLKPKLKFQIKLNQSHHSSYTKLKLFKHKLKFNMICKPPTLLNFQYFNYNYGKLYCSKIFPELIKNFPELSKIFPELKFYKLQKSKTKGQVLRSSIFRSYRFYMLG